RTLTGHSDRVQAVAFSPDGRFLAAGNLNQAPKDRPYIVKVWDLRTGKETATLEGAVGWFWAVTFAPDGKRRFCFAQKDPDECDLATRKIIRSFPGGSFPAGEGARLFYHFGLSPDGKKLAWGDAPANVKVWTICSDDPPTTLDGHTAPVGAAAFSP